MCLAKGISGGYLPLAATLATEEIFAAFLGRYEERKTFFHGHTYTGNALACAAALASLELFERERVIERLQGTIARLAAGLAREIEPLAHVAEVRRWGMMVGIELMQDPTTRRWFGPADRVGHRVIQQARRRGVIIRPLGKDEARVGEALHLVLLLCAAVSGLLLGASMLVVWAGRRRAQVGL